MSAEGQTFPANVLNFATGDVTVLVIQVDELGTSKIADTPVV